MQLSAIDANLLVALHALIEERSVVRAARRIGLSPSATSHALARARDRLGDALLVRAGRRLVPTPRALELVEPLRRLVAEMETILRAPATFAPAALRRTFKLATTDHVQFVLLRPLDDLLRKQAPGVDLHFLPLPARSAADLRDGTLDLSIGVFDEPTADLGRLPLFDDHLISVVRKGHPAGRSTLTLNRFAALDHVLVAPTGTATGLLDRQLAALGLSRRIARTIPTFLDAPFLVARTDQVVTLPARLVQPLLGLLGLRVLRAPIPLPSFTISAIWHRRYDADPAHAWLRNAIAQVGRSLPAAVTRKRAGSRRRV